MKKPKRSENIAKAVQLVASGLSQAAAARELGVTQQTVCRWLREAEKHGAKIWKQPQGRPRKAVPAAALDAAVVDDLAERLEGLGIPEELVVVRGEWLSKARLQADEALAAGNSAAARDWMRIYIDTAERLLQAIPPEPPDPVEDPANVAARTEVLEHLRRLAEVRGAELAKKLCEACRAAVLRVG